MSDAGHRVTHLGLCVTDVGRSQAFYEQALGFVTVGAMVADGEPTATVLSVPDARVELVYLERDGLRLELIGFASGATPGTVPRPMDQVGFTHLSLRVDDLDALAGSIAALGGSVLAETATVFDTGNRGVMALDPDGTRLELIERGTR